MKRIIIKTASATSAMALLAALPVTAMAHAGLDLSSTLMLKLHALAHILSEHPLILIAAAGAIIGAYSLHRFSRASHK